MKIELLYYLLNYSKVVKSIKPIHALVNLSQKGLACGHAQGTCNLYSSDIRYSKPQST